jgi:hypothetical protein
MRDADGAELLFGLGPIELELQVELTHETAGEGGVSFWVFNAGAKTNKARGDLHTLRLRLEPMTKDGRNVLVSDNSLTGEPG